MEISKIIYNLYSGKKVWNRFPVEHVWDDRKGNNDQHLHPFNEPKNHHNSPDRDDADRTPTTWRQD